MIESIASRELRNDTAGVLRRVAAGQVFLVTQGQQPVAMLSPVGRRRSWVSADEVWERITAGQADAALTAELAAVFVDRVSSL